MAKKKVAAIVKIQIPAGKASPAPPVGTALGPHGVAIMDFVKAYNAATENQVGTIVPVEITIFEDRSFTFVLKTPPTPVLLRERAGLEKASSEPGKTKVGRVTEAQVAEIAEIKMPDLNAYDLDAAKQQVRGTARSMGIEVVGDVSLDNRRPCGSGAGHQRSSAGARNPCMACLGTPTSPGGARRH